MPSIGYRLLCPSGRHWAGMNLIVMTKLKDEDEDACAVNIIYMEMLLLSLLLSVFPNDSTLSNVILANVRF